MKCKDCKIVCDGKEIATVTCTEDGFAIKCNEECKKLHKNFHECCQ